MMNLCTCRGYVSYVIKIDVSGIKMYQNYSFYDVFLKTYLPDVEDPYTFLK